MIVARSHEEGREMVKMLKNIVVVLRISAVFAFLATAPAFAQVGVKPAPAEVVTPIAPVLLPAQQPQKTASPPTVTPTATPPTPLQKPVGPPVGLTPPGWPSQNPGPTSTGSSTTTPAGTPGTMPFYIVTLGDSVMWGQGIPEGWKFRNRVANWLQSRTQGTYTVIENYPTFSHSGAEVRPLGSADGSTQFYGEVPMSNPSVWDQVDLTVADLTNRGIWLGAVRLVLLDGCINDVDFTYILNPVHSSGDVRSRTVAMCHDPVQNLLNKVISSFPNAAIVVTGYFQAITPDTDLGALCLLGGALGVEAFQAGPLGGVVGCALGDAGKGQVVANWQAFNEAARAALIDVVNQTNQQLFNQQLLPNGSLRVALAWPPFDSTNGYAASNTYLWKLEQFLTDDAAGMAGASCPGSTAYDQVACARGAACKQASSVTCLPASTGHPNQSGADVYASAIEEQLFTTLNKAIGFPVLPTMTVVATLTAPPLVAHVAVTDSATHQPVAQALVEINNGFSSSQLTTGADGTVTWSYQNCIILGRYTPCPVDVYKQGYWAVTYNAFIPLLRVQVTEPSGSFQSGSVLSVTDAATKTPIQGATVTWIDEAFHIISSPVSTGADGTVPVPTVQGIALGGGTAAKPGYASCAFALTASYALSFQANTIRCADRSIW